MFSSGGKNGRALARARAYPVLSLFDEMNRFFEDALPSAHSTATLSGFKPSIDLEEKEREYVIIGEFPGLEASDINIELRDNTITLSGEKRSSTESTEGARRHVERSFGSFSRSVSFPLEIDEDNSTAEMKNGVLTVRVPKSAKVVRGVKKISVKEIK